MNSHYDRQKFCPEQEASCPVCTPMVCTCRPNFFAGQRLTERQLNGLVTYVKEKSKLHNRYLHGWGTVCGLEASCDPCGTGRVKVSPGYALDPCGEDIVVCDEDSVDVCALIKDCCDERDDPCRPYSPPPSCKDVEQHWVLAIEYMEEPRRSSSGIQPKAPACGCSGGSSGGCGCGDGGKSCSCNTGAKPVARTPRDAPPECEPGEVCETYRYVAYPVPQEEKKSYASGRWDTVGVWNTNRGPMNELTQLFCSLEGPMGQRICCCVEPLIDLIDEGPDSTYDSNSRSAWHRWLCQLVERLADYLTSRPYSNCSLVERLRTVPCPSPDMPAEQFAQQMSRAREIIGAIFLDALINCICSALLPQCAGPADDKRVPLAVVTVTGRDCKVVKVCNWTPLRRIALTWPTMHYWFSALPIFGKLRAMLHKMCCDMFGARIPQRETQPPPVAEGVQPEGIWEADQPYNEGLYMMSSMNSVPQGTSPIGGLFKSMPRSPGPMSSQKIAAAFFGDVDNDFSKDERSPAIDLFSHLAAPITANMGVDAVASVLGPDAKKHASMPLASESEVNEIGYRVAELRNVVAEQSEQIAALQKALAGKE